MNHSRSGTLAALAAFFMWGILPLFWKQLSFLSPGTIVAQRTLWSLLASCNSSAPPCNLSLVGNSTTSP